MKAHILYVIDHTESGGTQVHLGRIMPWLKSQFELSIAVLGRSGPYSQQYAELGIPVSILGGEARRWDAAPAFGLVELIRRQCIDLMHALLFKSYVLGALAAHWTGCKLILHDQSSVYPQALARLSNYFPNRAALSAYLCAYRYALSRCDRVLVLTEEDARGYLDSYHIPREKILVVPNAIDVDEFSALGESGCGSGILNELGLPSGTKLVAMVARLCPEKDWLTFLRVAQAVNARLPGAVAFLIVGEGPMEQELREFAAEAGIANVFFLGFRRDVAALLRQTDVFVLTSRHEPFGIVMLEAMAAGCPVVATRCAGPMAILTDGVDGLLSGVGDTEGLATHVINLLQDTALRRRLIQNARHTVTRRYGIEAVAESLAAIYREVLAA